MFTEFAPQKKDFPIKICFLFQSIAFWPSWESFWYACKNDPRIEAIMLYCPSPTLSKGMDAQFKESEKFLQENNIDYIHVDDFDFTNIPDFMIVQTPYEGNRPSQWHIDIFARQGVKIVYISYGLEFVESEMNIRHHFRQTVHQCASLIFTFAKFMQHDYKKFARIGSDIVKAVGHPKFDALYNANKDHLPEWLIQKFVGRKCLVWHPHFPSRYAKINGKPVQSTFTWQDNVALLDYIKKRDDIFCIFMPHHLFWGVFEAQFGVSKSFIKKFKEVIKNAENIALWEGDYPDILASCDFFLGERSALTMEMLAMHKPICYLERFPEQYNIFGKDARDSFYTACNVNEVIEFINSVMAGKDPKKGAREQVFNTYFKEFFDGKCGKRIKEEVLHKFTHIQENLDKKVDVFIYFSNDDIRKSTVALCSVARNSSRPVRFHILEDADCPITQKNKAIIEELRGNLKNFSVKYIPLSTEQMRRSIWQPEGQFPLKLLCAYIIPDLDASVEKALYITSDMICEADIAPLFDIDIRDAIIAMPLKFKKSKNNILDDTETEELEQSLLFFNCTMCRKHDFSRKILAEYRKQGKELFNFHTVLDNLFHGARLILPDTYNKPVKHRGFSYFNNISVDDDQYFMLSENNKIFHKYLKMTPFCKHFMRYIPEDETTFLSLIIETTVYRDISVRKYYRLFKYIPIFKIDINERRTKYYLFDIIKVFTCKK